jgi:pilus assembly protein CpaB
MRVSAAADLVGITFAPRQDHVDMIVRQDEAARAGFRRDFGRDRSGYMAAVLDKGMRAISTEISPETGAGGFILPNDHVDVILSRRERDADKVGAGADSHSSETIMANIRVLAIDQTLGEKDGQKVVIGKTATLELTPRQAEQLALSRQLGTLSLSLRSLADAGETALPNDDDRASGKRAGINTVRFGVSTVTTPK